MLPARSISHPVIVEPGTMPRLAVVDLSPFVDPTIGEIGKSYWVSRVNVPRQARRRGIGNFLLAETCALCATLGVDAFLCPLSSDGNFHDADLREWYIRSGFLPFGQVYPERLSPGIPESYSEGLLVRRFRGKFPS